MINLEKETAELLAFLEKQPRLSDSAEQEGRKLGDRQAERIYNGGTVKDSGDEKNTVHASAEVESLLSRISPDCPYNDWFRIGCALKHEGYAYEVFRDWSAKAPKRFDEDSCRKTWNSIEDDHDNMVSLGTLHWMAEKSILPEPTTTEVMAKQAYDFISTLFRPGEHF